MRTASLDEREMGGTDEKTVVRTASLDERVMMERKTVVRTASLDEREMGGMKNCCAHCIT